MVNINDEDRRAPAACRAARASQKRQSFILPPLDRAAASLSPMLSALAISARSVMLGAGELALDRAVIEDQHPVAAADQLVIVGRIEQDRRAGVGEPAQQLVELLLGADIDAAGRIVEQDDARRRASAIWRSPPSAGCRPTARRPATSRSPAVLIASSSTISSISRVLGGAVDDAARRQPVERGEGEVVAHRHRQHQPFGLAVLGDQRHADCRRRLACAGLAMRAGLPSISTSPGAAAQHAEQRQQQLALALAVEAAEPDHLARARPRARCRAAGRSRTAAALRAPAWRRRAAGAASAGRHGCIRGRSSARRPRCRSWCRPCRWRRCGRCGTPCSRRRARRSRACGARCRAAPAPPGAGASARRRPWRRRRRSAPRSPRRGSGCAACATSALAISTICRRDSGRSLTSAQRMDVLGAGARQRLLGDPPLRAAVDQAEAGAADWRCDVVGDRQVRDQRQFLEDAGDAGAAGRGRRGEGDLAGRRASCGPRRARRRRP